ncbi:hypothetical protein I314_06369 [Cryptococcus bacillisporus CA1873]|uniref:Uncharacterized protein n=1 Tax=Cryptococcus bacillisporus CA1873 TaxID=1296111 RepID=A0ABR5B2P6_CRYGA|nr:hypothetical protein I314_06369 [Cryptococcus bacillisporus CA1873]|eukprot:KIR57864.1 hypothetical protein I314_06369 [Cryptococcus gattii CA1873]
MAKARASPPPDAESTAPMYHSSLPIHFNEEQEPLLPPLPSNHSQQPSPDQPTDSASDKLQPKTTADENDLWNKYFPMIMISIVLFVVFNGMSRQGSTNALQGLQKEMKNWNRVGEDIVHELALLRRALEARRG